MHTKLNIEFGCDDPKHSDNGWLEHLRQNMLVCSNGLPRKARHTGNSGLREDFSLLLEETACSSNLGLGSLVAHIMRASGCKPLPLDQRQVLVELHHASMAAAIAAVAIPCPTGD